MKRPNAGVACVAATIMAGMVFWGLFVSAERRRRAELVNELLVRSQIVEQVQNARLEITPKPEIRGWRKGKGWGWIWGKEDEIGSLNALTDESRAAALKLAKTGEVFDLGQKYSRESFKYAGHNPGEIITFRSPDGMAPHEGQGRDPRGDQSR